MASNNLIPTVIVDKNNKTTTVHKRPEAAGKTSDRNIPGPSVSAAATTSGTGEGYGDRLERIRANNARWDAGDSPSPAERGLVAAKAMGVVGRLMMTASQNSSERDRESMDDVAISIMSIGDSGNYEPLIIADRFACVYAVLGDTDTEWEDDSPVSFDGEDTADWETESTKSTDITNVIDLAFALREMGLMEYSEIPEHGEPRFFAHLYMAATGKINYRRDDDGTLALIRLVDEFPEHGETIVEGIDNELHAEGIRAVINDEVIPALAEGAL
jgi:hypothetical protein